MAGSLNIKGLENQGFRIIDIYTELHGAKEQKGGQKTGAVDAAQAAVNSFIATASVKRDIARF